MCIRDRRYVVIQPGVLYDEVAQYDLLEEGEYLDLLEKLPKDNQFLDDSDPNKFIAKDVYKRQRMGKLTKNQKLAAEKIEAGKALSLIHIYSSGRQCSLR